MWTSRPHPKWNELRVCIVTRSPGGSKYCSSSIWTQVILGIPADMWKSVTLYCKKITAGMTIGSSIVPFAPVQLLSVPFGPQIAVWKDKQHKGSIKWSRKTYTLKKAMCLIFKYSAPKSLPFYSIFTQNVESVLTEMGHPEYWSAASWTCCGKLFLRGQKDAGRCSGHDFKGGRCIKRQKCLQVEGQSHRDIKWGPIPQSPQRGCVPWPGAHISLSFVDVLVFLNLSICVSLCHLPCRKSFQHPLYRTTWWAGGEPERKQPAP